LTFGALDRGRPFNTRVIVDILAGGNTVINTSRLACLATVKALGHALSFEVAKGVVDAKAAISATAVRAALFVFANRCACRDASVLFADPIGLTVS
jgi:hypothetical protein